jgi:hypothetical protein
MLASSVPTNFQLPFGNSATGTYIRAIPVASQIGILAGAASLTDGFPPVCFADPLAGGVPPSGADFNGILNEITANIQWWGAGGYPKRNATFSAAIGGYPNGAILQSADNAGYWISTADNNTSDPDANGANWLPAWFRGMSAATVNTADVTLTLAQYARPIINVTGALTGNRSLILPNIAGEWTIINGTSGAYTLTVKTAAGTGIVALQGLLTRVVGNGTNIYVETAPRSTTSNNTGGKTTIASTTTPDIFAVTAGTLIDYTGTSTCTTFVAAPEAGATKILVCADACKFTAGATLLINGVLSGKTVTLGANAIVKVTAITTTLFNLEYSYSGMFELMSTSFTAPITTTVEFHSSNGYVDWSFQYFGFQGTSNNTSFYLAQIPASLRPNKSQWTHPVVAYNAGIIETVQHIEITDISNNGGGGPGLGTAIICRGGARTGGWTASGVKGILTNSIRYSIN